ncbi:MAG: bifunctional anthranilate synthase component II/anthranilate phosphoribosyltransferase [Spirochaetes bacterium]|nr:bifunctional anthranilate synthase component II/anthranilate phosphoribosyltransferase [Spirochaetota bacterium]
MILILDNYDSFTYNLYQIFLKYNYPIKVVRSDKISIDEIEKIKPSYIILSPGPGTPYEAGICIEVVQKLKDKYPILGICLGHQAILAAFGTPIVNASRIVHGKVEKIIHNGIGIFRNIQNDTKATRYHSLVGKEKDIPECFNISARSEDGEVMAVEHKECQLVGLQFHPESIGTKDGEKMIMNFLHYRRENVSIKEYMNKAVELRDFTFKESYDIMDELTEGNMTEAQIGSLLTSLAIKNVTKEELAGFASILKKKAISFPKPEGNEKRLDTCGTGGSKGAKTFNISSISSIICASCGANIVKHGNRAVTSKSGSADLLEALGINVEMPIEKSIEMYKKFKYTFLYARKYHNAMRFAAPARAAVGFKTVFNFIGPLANPAYATHQTMGVSDYKMTEKICEALNILGLKRAMVVSGLDGLDEISLIANTKITELNDGWIKTYEFDPEEIGIKKTTYDQLVGGGIEENKRIALDILNGKESPRSDIVFLNAGAGLYTYGIAKTIKEGYDIARTAAKESKAIDLLNKLSSFK